MIKEKINAMIIKLRNAKTDNERKQIIENDKIILSDDDLDQVSGGTPPTSYFCDLIKGMNG